MSRTVQKLQIIPVAPHMLPRLHDIEKQCFGDSSYPFFVFRQMYDLFSCFFYCAEIKHEQVGYVLGAISGENIGWVLSIAIDKQHRGLGIANKLLDFTIEQLRKNKIQYIHTTISPTNHASIQLFKQAGFVKEQFVENYFGEYESRLLFTRTLHHPLLRP